MARAEGAVPQEEEEEKLSEVKETSFLTTFEWNAAMDANMVYLCLIIHFFLNALWRC